MPPDPTPPPAAVAAAAANALRGSSALSHMGLGISANQAAALRELTKDMGGLPLGALDSMALAAQALNQNTELNVQLLAQRESCPAAVPSTAGSECVLLYCCAATAACRMRAAAALHWLRLCRSG